MAARFVDGNEEDIVQPKFRPTSSNSRKKDEEDISELRAIFYTRKQKFSLTFSPSRERKVVKSTNENGKNFSCWKMFAQQLALRLEVNVWTFHNQF